MLLRVVTLETIVREERPDFVFKKLDALRRERRRLRLAKRQALNYSREFAAGESAKRKQAAAGSDMIRYLSRTASPKVSPSLVPPPKTPSATGPRPWLT